MLKRALLPGDMFIVLSITVNISTLMEKEITSLALRDYEVT
jgi:hypothetical protein